MLHIVILAGGGGTRLWPLSRAHYPKQFLKLLGEYTLLQQTALRVSELSSPNRLWVVTEKEQEAVVRAQLSALPGFGVHGGNILLEPEPRNTAAAIGLAALHIQRADPHAVMLVLPADHWIEQKRHFVTLLSRAVEFARQEALVTLGIIPNRPETGYGYIHRGERLSFDHQPQFTDAEAYHVAQFVEKPSGQTAQAYLASGEYYWNAGIFAWSAATILAEITMHLPQLRRGLDQLRPFLDRKEYNGALTDVYHRLDAVSIDHGVLEKSSRLIVLPAEIGWSDLGEWTAIHRLSEQDANGNVLRGDVVAIDNKNSFIYSGRRTIATIGLKDTVVVDTDDALLVCPANRTQEVKAVVQQLQTRKAPIAAGSLTVQRPWGSYTVLEEGPNFKVKRVVVHPGAALSLQFHRHRSEHWVVVSGIAQVTNGEQVFHLRTDQSTYVPAGVRHRLANLGRELLEVIEVQTGVYLGEDDIVRLDDLDRRGNETSKQIPSTAARARQTS